MIAHLIPALCCFLACWPEIAPTTQASASKGVVVAVIVNKESKVTSVTLEELRAISKLDQQFWASNDRVALLLRPSGCSEMQIVRDHVYGLSSPALRKMWVEKLFAGKIRAIPTEVKTAPMAVRVVASMKNGISFVAADAVSDQVRVVAVDGKMPGEAGYPLVGSQPVEPSKATDAQIRGAAHGDAPEPVPTPDAAKSSGTVSGESGGEPGDKPKPPPK